MKGLHVFTRRSRVLRLLHRRAVQIDVLPPAPTASCLLPSARADSSEYIPIAAGTRCRLDMIDDQPRWRWIDRAARTHDRAKALRQAREIAHRKLGRCRSSLIITKRDDNSSPCGWRLVSSRALRLIHCSSGAQLTDKSAAKTATAWRAWPWL